MFNEKMGQKEPHLLHKGSGHRLLTLYNFLMRQSKEIDVYK